jgi:hypothetical protein
MRVIRAGLLGTVGCGVAIAVASTLAGCAGVGTPTKSKDDGQTYQVHISGIQLHLDAGNITLAANSGGQVVVKRHTRWRGLEPTLSEDFVGETMIITETCGGSDGCSVDYDVTVPAGTVAEAQTSSGDILVKDIGGALQLSTGSGDITVHNAQMRTTMSTESGRISADGIRGSDVSATSQSGDVTLAFAAAPHGVTAQTASGNVTVTLPTGDAYQVDASTDSGQRSVTVAVDAASTRHVTAKTNSGDVTVRAG